MLLDIDEDSGFELLAAGAGFDEKLGVDGLAVGGFDENDGATGFELGVDGFEENDGDGRELGVDGDEMRGAGAEGREYEDGLDGLELGVEGRLENPELLLPDDEDDERPPLDGVPPLAAPTANASSIVIAIENRFMTSFYPVLLGLRT